MYLSIPTPIRPGSGRAEFDARVDVVLATVELLETRCRGTPGSAQPRTDECAQVSGVSW
jgi:hypothetical protein